MRRSPSPRKRYNEYKRRRSRSLSHDGDQHKLKKRNQSPLSAQETETEFSFDNYKRELNKIILYSHESNVVANNLDDFWIFVKKYETTLKKAGKPVLDLQNQSKNESEQKNKFSKYDCINFITSMKFVDIATDDRNIRKLNKLMFQVFLNIVSIYIDFKNKEKFEKLKKLRQAQKDLPVANYRY